MTRQEEAHERPKVKISLAARFSCAAGGASLLAAALVCFFRFPNTSGVAVGLPLMAAGVALAWLASD